ncbi:DUF4255 domain-containing protein [Amycolatopsis sp. NPDC059657]|uniref:DUF4255 domain-containing protein n=1 Tax=Amycolatopsis sp. NPDC059657 TaxID=3346899 RepID=UPI00366FE5D6
MSNFLAVATVTAALKIFVAKAAADADLPVNVDARKPPADPPAEPLITLFLYQVTPNGSLRNHDAVTRAADGTVLKRPQHALDLHYLISFYGNEAELEPQRLLGAVTRSLHEHPTLSRQHIEEAQVLAHLVGSNLSAAPQRVRFTPTALDLDDMSKLWSTMIQTPFALSVVYQATAVLLDGESVPGAGKPVLRRQIAVEAFVRPVIDKVLSLPAGAPAGTQPGDDPITKDRELALLGSGLARPGMSALIGGVGAPVLRSTEDLVVLGQPSLPPGIHPVQLRYDVQIGRPAQAKPWLESNMAPYVRRPRVTSASIVAGQAKIKIDIPAGPEQRIMLLLDERTPAGKPRGYQFEAPFPLRNGEGPVDEFLVPITEAKPGRYLVRVQVDGAESPLDIKDGTFSGPTLDITG